MGHARIDSDKDAHLTADIRPKLAPSLLGRVAHRSSDFLDQSDSIVYAIVGLCFLVGALFGLAYTFWDFINGMSAALGASHAEQPAAIANTIIKLVSDLLLVLIIMEVLGTVVHYLQEHATSLRPFLFIGIVSATRGILSIGARLSVEQVQLQEFNRAMVELGVNAAVILALGITLTLIGKLSDAKETHGD